MQITLSTQVTLQETAEGAVLLDRDGEAYYELDPVGLRLWQELRVDGDFDRAVAQLLLEYETDEIELRADLLELLNDMADAGLAAVEASLD